jgi:hypothetical protein
VGVSRASRIIETLCLYWDQLTLTRMQYPAIVGQPRDQKMLYLCGICKPVQRSATNDRTLVAGAGVSGSSPLVGFLLCP